jgi:hypothetical protein
VTDLQRQSLVRAVALYNRGEFLQSQEVLEDLHHECDESDRVLVRTLAMVACGMHIHFYRGGGRGALNLMRQSLILLEDMRPACEGVATDALYDELRAYVDDLHERKRRGARFFDRWLAPKIRLDDR